MEKWVLYQLYWIGKARTRCQTPLLMPEREQAASLPLVDKTEKAVRKIWHPPEKVRESMDGLD